jgi:hypothetical protein
MTRSYFTPLDEADLQQLAHAAYLKGLFNPFKGKGSLEVWANQCSALRDGLIALAEERVLTQARGYPFNLLPVQLAQQVTGAGTTFCAGATSTGRQWVCRYGSNAWTTTQRLMC